MYPGSHMFTHFYQNARSALSSPAFGKLTEIIVQCPANTVLIFFGGSVHRGRKHLDIYGAIANCRKFASADSHSKWGAVKHDNDATYLPSSNYGKDFFALVQDKLIEPPEGLHLIVQAML